jgi:hypothetical protein
MDAEPQRRRTRRICHAQINANDAQLLERVPDAPVDDAAGPNPA